jgi:hypothetical protein
MREGLGHDRPFMAYSAGSKQVVKECIPSSIKINIIIIIAFVKP